jgi:hypothetical protein
MTETAQSASETEEKKSRGLGRYVDWAFVSVIVYVLSSGPVLALSYYEGMHHPALVVWEVYYPLLWAHDHTPLHKPLGMYWHLWCPEYRCGNG